MSVNSSSFVDAPLRPPHLSSNSSFHSPLNECFRSKTTIYIVSALSITFILILPLPILVFYLGFQRWRNRRSNSTAATSHTDVFTYHSTAMQLNEFLGFVLSFCGGYINLPQMMLVGDSIMFINSFGLAQFHLLTCVEHYLAVAHPITYLGLRQADGVRIRNVSTGCVWLLCFGCLTLSYFASSELFTIMYYLLMASFVIVVSFCCISSLCTLKRPGPGEVAGNREQVDQSKQRAFHTIMVIMGVVLLRFGGNTICFMMNSLSGVSDTCFLLISTLWLDLPSTLVLPLLFLHRAGKLPCWKLNSESG